jgi:hypothetical protein
MNYVTLDALPVSEGTRITLAKTPGIDGCVVYKKDRQLRVAVFGPDCDYPRLESVLDVMPEPTAVWRKPPQAAAVPRGRTAKALEILESNPSLTPYAAAKAAGVHVSAVYRALVRRTSRGVCSCCGQLLPTANQD